MLELKTVHWRRIRILVYDLQIKPKETDMETQGKEDCLPQLSK